MAKRILIAGMQHRAKQRIIDDEDEQKSLFECDFPEDYVRKKIEQYDLEYPDEKHFPVLLLSCIGPQHARDFYACIDGNTLLIQQSELFDFRTLDLGTLDLFAHLLLSSPHGFKP